MPCTIFTDLRVSKTPSRNVHHIDHGDTVDGQFIATYKEIDKWISVLAQAG